MQQVRAVLDRAGDPRVSGLIKEGESAGDKGSDSRGSPSDNGSHGGSMRVAAHHEPVHQLVVEDRQNLLLKVGGARAVGPVAGAEAERVDLDDLVPVAQEPELGVLPWKRCGFTSTRAGPRPATRYAIRCPPKSMSPPRGSVSHGRGRGGRAAPDRPPNVSRSRDIGPPLKGFRDTITLLPLAGRRTLRLPTIRRDR